MMQFYNHRMRLAELGYTSPMEELSVFDAEVFTIIHQEIQRLSEEDRKSR